MPRPKRIQIKGEGYNLITRADYEKAKAAELARLRTLASNRIVTDMGVVSGVEPLTDTVTKTAPDGTVTKTVLMFHRYRLGPNVITKTPVYPGVSIVGWTRTTTTPDGTVTTTTSDDKVVAA